MSKPFTPSGEELRRNAAVVSEILDLTGHTAKADAPAQTPEDEAIRRLSLANEAIVQRLKVYYDANPLTSNLTEVERLISECYLQEFVKWSKDDLMFMLLLQTTKLAMKKWGYPMVQKAQGNKIWTPGQS